MSLRSDVFWITITGGIRGELFQIEHLIRIIGLHQNIYVQIDVTENAAFDGWRHVYVAVVEFGRPIALQKSKDVVPAIRPIVFNRPSSTLYVSEQMVLHLIFKFGIKDD